jgi:hypothetical protein
MSSPSSPYDHVDEEAPTQLMSTNLEIDPEAPTQVPGFDLSMEVDPNAPTQAYYGIKQFYC